MAERRAPTLSDVVARYVEAAMPIASSNLQQGELIGWPTGRWTRQGDGQYHRQEVIHVLWAPAIDHRAAALHALPEYHDVVAFIKANREWASQFDNLVGTWQSRGRLDLEQFIDGCLGEALAAQSDGREPVAAGVARSSTIEDFLNASDVEIETFAPLLGLQSFGLGRVEMDSNLRLEPIDDDELERLFTVGLLAPTFPRHPFFAPPSHTVRIRHRTPKTIGDMDTSKTVSPPDDPSKAAEDAVEELVACLRIFKEGLVAVGGRASTMPPPFGGYQYHGSSGHPVFGGQIRPFLNAYMLDESEVPELQALWTRMHSRGFQKSKQLALSVRRFAYKGERTRVDDQLVDLIVAAEALFLGAGDDETRGELRFRLSLRAARYIRASDRSQRAVYRLFMAAYRMRSRLVHGNDANPITVAGEELNPARMVVVVEQLLRLALKQAIDEASVGLNAWAIDWEALLFPEPDARPAVESALTLPSGQHNSGDASTS